MEGSPTVEDRIARMRPDVRLDGTDSETLGLAPGEWVQVLSVDEIERTLDTRGMNGDIAYMQEMRKYAGARLRVVKRLTKLHVEGTGRMRYLKGTVLLEGSTCDGTAHGGCDACCPHLWREVWLRRSATAESH